MASSRIYRDWLIKSKPIDDLTEPAQILWWRLWLVVDDYGRYYADDDHIRMAAFPVSPKKYNSDQISEYLGEFRDAGLVRFYDAEGTEYLEIQSFEQRTRYASKFPTPTWRTDPNLSAAAQQTPEPAQSQTKVRPKSDHGQTEVRPKSGRGVVEDEGVDVGGGEGISSSSSADSKLLKPGPLKKRINRMLGRHDNDPWTQPQDFQLSQFLHWEPELYDLLEKFYAAPAPREDDRKNPLCLRRSNLSNFLEQLSDEVGKARNWQTTIAVRTPPGGTVRLDKPPLREWKAVADKLWSKGWPRDRTWKQLTPGQRVEITEAFKAS